MNEYCVQFHGWVEIVLADELIFDENTGQKLFYRKAVGGCGCDLDVIIAIAPIDAMVSLMKPKEEK